MSGYKGGYETSKASPAHPVEPEPSAAVREGRSHFPGVVCKEWAEANGWTPPQLAQAVESGERHGFWTQAQRERVARQVMSHSEAENVVRYVDGLREALRLQREAIEQAEYALHPNQGERPDPSLASQWLRTTFPPTHPNHVDRATLSDSGPPKEGDDNV